MDQSMRQRQLHALFRYRRGHLPQADGFNWNRTACLIPISVRSVKSVVRLIPRSQLPQFWVPETALLRAVDAGILVFLLARGNGESLALSRCRAFEKSVRMGR